VNAINDSLKKKKKKTHPSPGDASTPVASFVAA